RPAPGADEAAPAAGPVRLLRHDGPDQTPAGREAEAAVHRRAVADGEPAVGPVPGDGELAQTVRELARRRRGRLARPGAAGAGGGQGMTTIMARNLTVLLALLVAVAGVTAQPPNARIGEAV